MIIPIQREGGATFTSEVPPSQTKSSSTYTSKKSVRITPKVTEIEMRHPIRQTPLSVSFDTTKDFPTTSSAAKSNWDRDEFSALKVFDESNKRWARDDIEGFLLPSVTSRSLLKDKFDNFTSNMFNEHPIKIETFNSETDKYVLTLNVQQFKPEELQVKITDDTISITGKHEEKQDERNFSCQEYSRKHSLPQGVKADDVKCRMSVDGILTVTAPRKVLQPALEHGGRTIPIQHSGLSAIRV